MKKKLTLKKRTLEVVDPEKLEEAPGGHSCTCDEDTCPATDCATCAQTCGGTCLYNDTCETTCEPSDCC